MRDVLGWAIKAHEIQGVYALRNAFNRVGLDHVILVRLASTAVATAMLGGNREEVITAVSHSWIDNGVLRTYRHAPNTGPRKSWAAGEPAGGRDPRAECGAAQGDRLSERAEREDVGLCRRRVRGREFEFERDFGSYVMENILFKISWPAEFHAQTAVECAMRLHEQVRDRLEVIERIEIHTQEAAIRIIDKTGPLDNYADRDHCLQYMVAVPLIFGRLTAEDYGDEVAADPRIDALRGRMQVSEDPGFTRDYFDPAKRYIGNAVQVFFRDGSATPKVSINYPVGHRQRREEGIPLLLAKCEDALRSRLPEANADRLMALAAAPGAMDRMPVADFLGLYET